MKLYRKGTYSDLFDEREELPEKVLALVLKYDIIKADKGLSTKDVDLFLKKIKRLGYIFNYDAFNRPFALREIDVQLHQVKGYEEFK